MQTFLDLGACAADLFIDDATDRLNGLCNQIKRTLFLRVDLISGHFILREPVIPTVFPAACLRLIAERSDCTRRQLEFSTNEYLDADWDLDIDRTGFFLFDRQRCIVFPV